VENRSGSTAAHLSGLPVFLRAPRSAGLWLIGALITVASLVAFALSYHGLFDWALHHQWPTSLAVWFPFLIDVLIVVAEVVLFVAAIDGKTPWRVRAAAWAVLVVFTALSATGNATHAAHATPMTRGGFALPPLVLAVALGFGLGELKRQAAKYRDAVPGRVPAKWQLPSHRQVRGDYNCGPDTAKKIRAGMAAAVRAAERSRGGAGPPFAPAARDTPAGHSPLPAGALSNGQAHG
jgi:hypothetical protein